MFSAKFPSTIPIVSRSVYPPPSHHLGLASRLSQRTFRLSHQLPLAWAPQGHPQASFKAIRKFLLVIPVPSRLHQAPLRSSQSLPRYPQFLQAIPKKLQCAGEYDVALFVCVSVSKAQVWMRASVQKLKPTYASKAQAWMHASLPYSANMLRSRCSCSSPNGDFKLPLAISKLYFKLYRKMAASSSL